MRETLFEIFVSDYVEYACYSMLVPQDGAIIVTATSVTSEFGGRVSRISGRTLEFPVAGCFPPVTKSPSNLHDDAARSSRLTAG